MRNQTSITFLIGIVVVLIVVLVLANVLFTGGANLGEKGREKATKIFVTVNDISLQEIFGRENALVLVVKNVKYLPRKLKRVIINGVSYSVDEKLEPGDEKMVSIATSFSPGTETINLTLVIEEEGIEIPVNFGKVTFYVAKGTTETSVYGIYTITLANPNSYNLDDYQTKLVIDSSNFNNWDNIDCSKVYFTDENDVRLPYWVEYCNESKKKLVAWVRMSLPASSNINIKMKFGSYSSNPDNVFLLYDDFSSGTLDNSKWNTANAGGYTVSSGQLIMDGEWNSKGIKSILTFSSPIRVEARFRADDSNKDIDFGIGYNCLCWGNDWGLVDAYEGGDGIRVRIGGSATSRTGDIPDTSWHNVSFIFTTSFYKVETDWGDDVSKSGTGLSSGYISLFGDTDSTTRHVYVDWIRVRKYAENEPYIVNISS